MLNSNTTRPKVSGSRWSVYFRFLSCKSPSQHPSTTHQVDEELVKSQQAIYSVAGVDEQASLDQSSRKQTFYQRLAKQTPAAPILAREKKKRKKEEYDPTQPAVIKRGKGTAQSNASSSKDKAPPKAPKNTAVYVTNIPVDAEQDEIQARFARCGVIEEDDAGEPKIKMYAREDGTFSGEALVVFFKEDSVTLAVNLLDDAELRLGDASTRMKVQKAEFGHKNTSGGGEMSGEGSAPRKTVNKKKATKRIGKMQRCTFLFMFQHPKTKNM